MNYFLGLILLVCLTCSTASASNTIEEHLLQLDKKVNNLQQENKQLRNDLHSMKEQVERCQEQGSQNVIAFSAYHNDGYADYNSGSKVNFPNVISNLGGAYDASTSVFTCPVTGVYHFAVYGDCLHDHRFLLGIYKEGSLVATANGNSETQRQSSVGVVVECNQGESVEVRSVEVTSRIYNYNNYRTSVFTGYLISI